MRVTIVDLPYSVQHSKFIEVSTIIQNHIIKTEVSGSSISRYFAFLLLHLRPQPVWFAAPFGCHAGHVPGRASPRRSPRAPAGFVDDDGDDGLPGRGGHAVAPLAAAGTAGLGDFSMAWGAMKKNWQKRDLGTGRCSCGARINMKHRRKQGVAEFFLASLEVDGCHVK